MNSDTLQQIPDNVNRLYDCATCVGGNGRRSDRTFGRNHGHQLADWSAAHVEYLQQVAAVLAMAVKAAQRQAA